MGWRPMQTIEPGRRDGGLVGWRAVSICIVDEASNETWVHLKRRRLIMCPGGLSVLVYADLTPVSVPDATATASSRAERLDGSCPGMTLHLFLQYWTLCVDILGSGLQSSERTMQNEESVGRAKTRFNLLGIRLFPLRGMYSDIYQKSFMV